MFMTILNSIFCLSFIMFAYVNLNDKDSWLWVAIYLVAAICCGLAIFKKFYPFVYLGAMFVYIVYALLLFFSKDGVKDWITVYNTPSLVESMQATKPYIEKAREFFGLLIVITALAVNYFVSR